ncbi:MAG: 2,3-bisphosphoglycerate-independent phosphoglycerate mutase, partial [Candidatus Lokiarchaeota archaeon]|nr:2,3-bisphosphoglycerate-independent phosphoglycerate mutase [Candidatus Lokiarchaeota archaeon]
TPLEVAYTPNMDTLADKGATGLIYPTIEPHIPVGSGPAHLALFGYELETYPGRGALEALGAGLDLPQGSVIIRINFATVDEHGVVLDRRAGRISGKEAKKLLSRLNNLKLSNFEDLKYKIYHTKGYRGVLVISGRNASSQISNSDPREVGKPILDVIPKSKDKTAKLTAKFVNSLLKRARKELSTDNDTKANAIVSRGAGAIKLYESFTDRYKFENPIFISSYPLYKGVARYLRIYVKEPKPSNERIIIKDKFKTAAELIRKHDMIILHVKDPDIAGEDGDYKQKKAIIEEIDKHIKLILNEMNDDDDTIVITSDHSTPALMKEHSGHPIPLLMMGPYVRRDRVKKFNELDSIKGSLGVFRAIELMNLILMSTKRLKVFWP